MFFVYDDLGRQEDELGNGQSCHQFEGIPSYHDVLARIMPATVRGLAIRARVALPSASVRTYRRIHSGNCAVTATYDGEVLCVRLEHVFAVEQNSDNHELRASYAAVTRLFCDIAQGKLPD